MKLTSPETVKTTGPIVVKVEIRALGFSGFPLPIVLYLCVGKSAREESVSLRANEFLRDQVPSFKKNGTIRREGKLYIQGHSFFTSIRLYVFRMGILYQLIFELKIYYAPYIHI